MPLPMPASTPTVIRVRPMADQSWPDNILSDTWSLLPPPGSAAHLQVGVEVYRPRHDYAVRRAFLTSYQFSIRESFGKRMARAMRELSVEAMAVLRGVASRVSLSPRRLGCRLFRVLFPAGQHHLSSSFSPVRCFFMGSNHSCCVVA